MNILYMSLSSLSNKTRLINVFNNFNKLPHSWVVPLVSPCLSLPPSQWWTGSARLLITSTHVSYSLKVPPAKILTWTNPADFCRMSPRGESCSHAGVSLSNLTADRSSSLPCRRCGLRLLSKGPVVFWSRRMDSCLWPTGQRPDQGDEGRCVARC